MYISFKRATQQEPTYSCCREEGTHFLNRVCGDNRKIMLPKHRNSKLKEMYIVRYADDFKIFCRTRSDAKKIFTAVEKWLNERLHLEISPEKSKIVNLKKQYSDFLGFKLKVHKKADRYTVISHISDKAEKRIENNLIEQIKRIKRASDEKERHRLIALYNSKVIGIHNYYDKAMR